MQTPKTGQDRPEEGELALWPLFFPKKLDVASRKYNELWPSTCTTEVELDLPEFPRVALLVGRRPPRTVGDNTIKYPHLIEVLEYISMMVLHCKHHVKHHRTTLNPTSSSSIVGSSPFFPSNTPIQVFETSTMGARWNTRTAPPLSRWAGDG